MTTLLDLRLDLLEYARLVNRLGGRA